MMLLIKRDLPAAQNRMKQYANRRSEWEFLVGDMVYLKLGHSHQRALTHSQVSKLSPKFFGAFPILAKFGTVAYKMQLPATSHIHPIFHVSLLKKSVGAQPVSLLCWILFRMRLVQQRQP